MKKMILIFCILLAVGSVFGQANSEADVLIEQILDAEKQQNAIVHNVTFDAEYIEGEEKDGKFIEKIRFDKKIYVKYDEDTAYLVEDYIAYYKDSEKQSDKDLESEAKDRLEKKEKRKSKDISYSMLKPFYPENRELYTIEYLGLADDEMDGYTCHFFKVKAKEEDDNLINGDYYFDVESFQLVHVDFSPAKLTKKAMFKMKELNMSISYKEYENNLWFPTQIEIAGKGKAMFFIGVNFAGTEYYRNPVINQDIESKFIIKDED